MLQRSSQGEIPPEAEIFEWFLRNWAFKRKVPWYREGGQRGRPQLANIFCVHSPPSGRCAHRRREDVVTGPTFGIPALMFLIHFLFWNWRAFPKKTTVYWRVLALVSYERPLNINPHLACLVEIFATPFGFCESREREIQKSKQGFQREKIININNLFTVETSYYSALSQSFSN